MVMVRGDEGRIDSSQQLLPAKNLLSTDSSVAEVQRLI